MLPTLRHCSRCSVPLLNVSLFFALAQPPGVPLRISTIEPYYLDSMRSKIITESSLLSSSRSLIFTSTADQLKDYLLSLC